jgi:hypothetical protein
MGNILRPDFGGKGEIVPGARPNWFTAREDEPGYLSPTQDQRDRAAKLITGDTIKNLLTLPPDLFDKRIANLLADEDQPNEIKVLRYMRESDWFILGLLYEPGSEDLYGDNEKRWSQALDTNTRAMALRIARVEHRQQS